MKHLIGETNKITRSVRGKHLYLFLDFDGTLAAIRRHPEKAKISAATVRVLEKLLSQRKTSIAIVSGRKLQDIRKRVGVKGIVYVGNHGLEVAGGGLRYTLPEALKAQETIKKISRKLKAEYRFFKGIVVEDKTLTLSVHFRMLQKNRIKEAEQIFRRVTGRYRTGGKVVVTKGKKIWEVRPPVNWNKGKAVLRLLGEKNKIASGKVTPIYIGDDKTDEDAFRLLKGKGYSVKVATNKGEPSLAGYYLKSTSEVRDFLKKVYFSRKESIKDV
ncbi:trehalose-phosphatase [Candidatus Omnitrophota bacterium]